MQTPHFICHHLSTSDTRAHRSLPNNPSHHKNNKNYKHVYIYLVLQKNKPYEPLLFSLLHSFFPQAKGCISFQPRIYLFMCKGHPSCLGNITYNQWTTNATFFFAKTKTCQAKILGTPNINPVIIKTAQVRDLKHFNSIFIITIAHTCIEYTLLTYKL